ncbi:hypothetical protein NQZ68_007101 [Dissostichus eleginoides]|nr:hypothetical protein NQZ68_007101 [Dissostichus eleginoides]
MADAESHKDRSNVLAGTEQHFRAQVVLAPAHRPQAGTQVVSPSQHGGLTVGITSISSPAERRQIWIESDQSLSLGRRIVAAEWRRVMVTSLGRFKRAQPFQSGPIKEPQGQADTGQAIDIDDWRRYGEVQSIAD